MKRDSPMYGYWQIEIETEIEIEGMEPKALRAHGYSHFAAVIRLIGM